MRSHSYDDVLAGPRRKKVPEVPAEPGLVVEDPASGYCGAVVKIEYGNVVLEDAKGRHRVFPLVPAGFLLEGKPVTLVPYRAPAKAPARQVSASGSVKVQGLQARVARDSRIWVEGKHDAELVEKVWGDDLRVEGIVVEPLHGIDDLAAAVADFRPGPGRRLGVLVDHLVPDSKESRIADAVMASPGAAGNVLIVGHPYVDVWQAIRPAVLGIEKWPAIPRGQDWKTGILKAFGWPHATKEDIGLGWQKLLGAVRTYADLEASLLGRVEEVIDFLTVP